MLLHYNKHKAFQVDIGYEITLKCNNRCSYCYNLHSLDNRTTVHEPTFQSTIREINRFMEEQPEYEVRINLLGGEPLLVKNKVIEFLEKISPRALVDIYANLNYSGSHLKGLEKFENATIVCSWHESSDPERIKKNLLMYDGNKEISFFLTNNNFDTMYQHAQWAISHNLQFRVESVRDVDNSYMFTNFSSERFHELHIKSRDIRRRCGIWKPDDTNVGLDEDSIRNISQVYHTVCKINQYIIKYNGEIGVSCGYPHRSHIDDGIKIQEVYCNGYMCYCDTGSYKKLVRKSNPRDEN